MTVRLRRATRARLIASRDLILLVLCVTAAILIAYFLPYRQ